MAKKLCASKRLCAAGKDAGDPECGPLDPGGEPRKGIAEGLSADAAEAPWSIRPGNPPRADIPGYSPGGYRYGNKCGGWNGGPTVTFGIGSLIFVIDESFSAATFFRAAKLDMSSMSPLSNPFFLFIVSRMFSSEALLLASSHDTSESIGSEKNIITKVITLQITTYIICNKYKENIERAIFWNN